MSVRAGRIFPLGRIVALVVIAVAIVGLAYLRFAPSAGSVVVPHGAKAGAMTLSPCTFGSEGRSYAADCGTLVVPENRAVTGSRLIALPVTRIRAQTAHPGDPLFYLYGGPGLSNMTFE